MKRWLSPVLGLLVFAGALSPVWGNGAPPPRLAQLPEAKTVDVKVVIDERVKAPRLVIPKALMGDKKGAMLESTPTIVAGLALTLACVSGGVWLVRRGKVRTIAAVVLALSAVAFGASTLLADIAKPPPPPPTVPVKLPADITFTDKVEVEFVEKGDEVKLLVKKAWVTEKKAEPKPETKPEAKPNEKSPEE